MASSDTSVVETAPEADWIPALFQVYRDLPPQQRLAQIDNMIASARCGDVSLELLLRACRNGKSVGVVLGHLMPGSVAVVWPPQINKGESEDTSQQLLEELLRRLKERDIDLAQAVIPPTDGCGGRRLEAGGFKAASELIYMALSLGTGQDGSSNSDLGFELHHVGDHFDRLGSIIEATYVDTLDMPDLDGCRNINDTLDGYKNTGTYRPDWWWIVRDNGQDVGCLLLADHPQSEQTEMIYMGVMPVFRGHGLGRSLTNVAAEVSLRAGRKRLVLAVDVGNRPAVKAYEEAGFLSWDRRRVFLKKL